MEPRAEIRRRTRLSPEARRDQLMECAVEVFSRRGIGRAGHAEIAEQAKVSVATVFNYFNTQMCIRDRLRADRFCLYQSVSTPDGVHYEPLACWPLRARVKNPHREELTP